MESSNRNSMLGSRLKSSRKVCVQMTMKPALIRWRGPLSLVVALTSMLPLANATNAWGNFHWARSSNPFTVKLADNVSGVWDSHLAGSSVDWSNSSVLDTTIVAGGQDPRKCRARSGRIEVCNAKYGKNGWLGLASVWASGDHIVQATVKLNDSYFTAPPYNTGDWGRSVMCQEVGHGFGLDHQDENFNNTSLLTCMDYQNPPYPSPNAHDYAMLETIYAHLDAAAGTLDTGDTGGKGKSGIPTGFTGLEIDGPGQWGHQVASFHKGEEEVYEADFGGGNRIITFVRRANQ